MGLIFDLDQTLIDSSCADELRKNRKWSSVYNLISQFRLYPNIVESLSLFRSRGIKICIVTSSPRPYCEKVVKFWKIPCDSMVCYHDTSRRKPYPDPIYKGLELLGNKTDMALSFGDRDIDILASNNAGVKSVACLWGSLDTDSLRKANPHYILNSPDELVSFVLKVFEPDETPPIMSGCIEFL